MYYPSPEHGHPYRDENEQSVDDNNDSLMGDLDMGDINDLDDDLKGPPEQWTNEEVEHALFYALLTLCKSKVIASFCTVKLITICLILTFKMKGVLKLTT